MVCLPHGVERGLETEGTSRTQRAKGPSSVLIAASLAFSLRPEVRGTKSGVGGRMMNDARLELKLGAKA